MNGRESTVFALVIKLTLKNLSTKIKAFERGTEQVMATEILLIKVKFAWGGDDVEFIM